MKERRPITESMSPLDKCVLYQLVSVDDDEKLRAKTQTKDIAGTGMRC